MSVLARAASRDLEAAWVALGTRPVYRVVRTPELGMVMLRGTPAVPTRFNPADGRAL
jgi:alpha-D-ribose 1-methylphosphonate 5-triphosphate synthase subunit PhnG